MTDEFTQYGPGFCILEFVFSGPKTYAYHVFFTNNNGIVEVCRIRGPTLNLKTSEHLNFKQLKEMVQSEIKRPSEIEETRIKRTNNNIDIVTVKYRKFFKVPGQKEGTREIITLFLMVTKNKNCKVYILMKKNLTQFVMPFTLRRGYVKNYSVLILQIYGAVVTSGWIC